MTRIFDRKAPVPGAIYRVLPWHNIYGKDPTTPIGFGLEERLPGHQRYRAVAWCGAVYPWRTKEIAKAAVQIINQCSGVAPGARHTKAAKERSGAAQRK